MRNGRSARAMSKALLATVIMACTPAWAAMKITSTTVPLPKDAEPVPLSGLAYPGEWTVEFPSMRLDRDPDGGDPLEHVWTMLATSTRPMVQKVMIEVTVLDGNGKKIRTTKKMVVVKAMAVAEELPVKMKIKAADWEHAEQVRIKASFMVL